jgi:alkanesulfonate monooxygenase SsuD/methylene tetrahydromethanopterin reductase-like flavin-dependent oxidoreductase (luciferase family)
VTHLAFELRTGTPDPVLASVAARVEEAGYRSAWVNNPPGEDGIGQLSKVAAATARITLGTAVVPISAVPPDAILRRLDETALPPERLRLGIGSGTGPAPLRRMAEALAYLRERTPAEIVVGALGPRMRELGARLADAVLLNTVTPELARAAADEIRAQAKAASRPVPGVYVNVMTGVGQAQIAELEGSAAFLSRLRGALPPGRRQAGADLDRGEPAQRAAPAARTVAGHRRRGDPRPGERGRGGAGQGAGGRRHRGVLELAADPIRPRTGASARDTWARWCPSGPWCTRRAD